MKKTLKLVAAISAVACSVQAHSQAATQDTAPWMRYSSTVYALAPVENKKISLTTYIDPATHALSVNIVDYSNINCPKHQSSDEMQPIPPISIDGQYVKFMFGCVDGLGIFQPISAQGKKFLLDKVQSGNTFSINIADSYGVVHFKSSNLPLVIKKLQQAANAM